MTLQSIRSFVGNIYSSLTHVNNPKSEAKVSSNTSNLSFVEIEKITRG